MAAIDNFETMLARGQDNALLRYGLGNEYRKLGQFDKAIEHFQKALAHDATYSAAWKLLGATLADAGQRQAAIDTYEKGMLAAQQKGDVQAAREMAVFVKRLRK